jgi:predicted transcriptional regulator
MRTREEVVCQILQSASEGATHMSLMYQTYLSYDTLRAHLNNLTLQGLLEYVAGDMKYRTTRSGHAYLLARTQTSFDCGHQCKKCGMLYLCGLARCQNSFHHGLCALCNKSFEYMPTKFTSDSLATDRIATAV